MKKRLISILLTLLVVMGLLPTAAFAAETPEEALGEVQIYNGGYKMSYLSINGRVRELIYTYYNYDNGSGSIREIPAYCVNPNIYGVPQSVPEGESIEYLADEKASDPKVVGIVANGYPTRSLQELGLENKYQGYYATKMALWTYLLGNWNINNLKVNPALTGVELQRAQKILAAAKDIYARGTAWTEMLSPEVTCTPDRETAYEVTVDGRQYKQQVFTFWSKTWVCDYAVNVSFTNPDEVPEGTRIVDMNNKDISTITTEATGDGYAGKFKVLYPLDSVAGETGSVQLSFSTNVYKYAVFYAICQETDKYGNLQNYVVDTDPTVTMRISAYSNYADEPTDEYDTGLRILKYETGTEIPIAGALFEVIGPDGDSIGTFVTNGDGRIEIPLKKSGNYTVIEREAASHYVISEEPAQNVTVVYDEVAEVTFFNDPYGYSTVVGKGWLTSLIEAGEGVSLSFQLVKQPREKTVNAIGQTTMINRSRMRDVGDTRQDFEELGDAIGAGLYLKEGMNREGQDFYYMHTLIEVIADDPDTLEQRMTAVETLCVASDMLAKRCEYKHEQAFLSFLPLLISDPDIERKSRRNALTSGVAASFPFASFELSDQKGIFLGLNLYNRSPVFLDFYDDYKYTNGNFAGFGNTGAGKSVLLQCIGKRVREQQRKVIYIVPEKGHEYIPLCEALGGQYIKLGPSSDDSIGLMDIRRFRDDPYNARTKGLRHDSLMAEKVSWLTGWYSLNKKNLTEEDRAYIDAALIECYNNFGITFDNASVFEEDGVTPKRMPVIKDWYDVLMSKPQTEHLATVLTRYVSGSAISMGGPCNIDPDNPYTVIDLSGLPDDLMLPWVYAATGFATDIILQNGDVGTALLSDELWKLVGAHSNPLAADYTVRMVKLIRSQGGIAGVTSQGMADMMALDGGKYGKSILDSCRIKMVMQMEEQEARLIQKVLNLTEEETKMITRFHRGEGLLCIGHNHVPIAVHVSPKEYDAITTSPTDLRARMNS